MKFLVLGSAGLIGRTLCEYLMEQSHDVTGFDLIDSQAQDLRIPNNQQLIHQIENCDFVFFLAWDVGGAKYLQQQQQEFSFLHNNIAIMYNVFDILSKTKKPFLFTSSQMSGYAKSTYGLTKLLGEHLTRSLDSVVVKLWNVYGYEPISQKSHVVADFLHKALTANAIDMLTDGQEQRQFLYARDCAECLYILSQKYQALARDKEYHVTSFEWTSIHDLAWAVADCLPGVVVQRGHNQDMIQAGNKIQPNNHVLEYWTPSTDLRSGIKQIIERYR
jgi:nucleoside-diphosphate-sugar epimerase